MRSLLYLTGFIIGCPSAPKVVIEGGLDESFVDDEGEGTTDGDENSVDDTGDDGSGAEDGSGDGGSGEDGAGEDGAGEDGAGEDGDDDAGDDDAGDDDAGDGGFAGAYEGTIGREVATTDEECTEPATLYVDADNSFVVSGLCSGWWGDRDMRFEGSFNADGEASGRWIGDIVATESEGEIEGYIDGDEVSLSADVSYGFDELKAFFYTE